MRTNNERGMGTVIWMRMGIGIRIWTGDRGGQ